MLALLVLAALLLLPTAADAATIRGCAKKSGGDLRVLGAGKKCKKSERAVSWAESGEDGRPGANGAPGASGAQGAQGAQGAPGATGAPGADAPIAGEPNSEVVGTATLTLGSGSTLTFDVRGLTFGADGATVAPVTVVKDLDAASPRLIRMAADGTRAPALDVRLGGTIDLHYGDVGVKSVRQRTPENGEPAIETTRFYVADGLPDVSTPAGAPAQPGVATSPVGRVTIDGRQPFLIHALDWKVESANQGQRATFDGFDVLRDLDRATIGRFLDDLEDGIKYATGTIELFRPGSFDVATTYALTDLGLTRAVAEVGTTPGEQPLTELGIDYSRLRVTDNASSVFTCWDLAAYSGCG